MRKLILLLMAVSSLAFSQTTGANVVVQQILAPTNYTTGTSSFSKFWVQNIGQSNHALILVFKSVVGTVTVNGNILGSPDCNGSNTLTISQQFNGVAIPALGADVTKTIIGYSPYPCVAVQAQIIVASASSVTVSAYYVGNSQPSNVVVDQFAAYNGMLSSTTQLNADGMPHTLLTNPSSTLVTFALYSLVLDVDATATEFKLGCSLDGTTFTKTLLDIRNLAKSLEPIIIPSSIRPYGSCDALSGGSNRVIYSVTGATATLNTSYRFE